MRRFILSAVFAGVIAVAAYALLSRQSERMNEPSASGQPSTVAQEAHAPAAAPKVFSPDSFSPEVQTKLAVLDQILKSKNDNDPRLDTEFRNLTPEMKAALEQKYAEMVPEDRNGRGTIVFLLGREMNSPEDLEFMKQVLSEPPCLSLANCGKEMQASRGGDEDSTLGVSTTLAYPQEMAIAWLEKKVMAAGANGLTREMSDAAWKVIEAAKGSPVDSVSRRAAEIERKLRAARS